jgi:His/Glu/Gln/Arg/opine family amino acid ABC transporter permease subunit
VNYVFEFNVVWQHFPELLEGAWLTIRLSATAMALGLCLAIVCAYGQSAGPRPVRALWAAYVELIRNTPFLIQIFISWNARPRVRSVVGCRLRELPARPGRPGASWRTTARPPISAISHDRSGGLGSARKPTFVHCQKIWREPSQSCQYALPTRCHSTVKTRGARLTDSVTY